MAIPGLYQSGTAASTFTSKRRRRAATQSTIKQITVQHIHRHEGQAVNDGNNPHIEMIWRQLYWIFSLWPTPDSKPQITGRQIRGDGIEYIKLSGYSDWVGCSSKGGYC
jgi:hypothetical protein